MRWQKLPIDDFIDIADDLTLGDLEKLDRAAAKTEKNLEKVKRKAGPVLPKDGRRAPLTGAGPLAGLPVGSRNKEQEKQDKRIEKRVERLTKKVEKDVVKNFGKNKQGFLSNILGDNAAQNILSFGNGPVGFLKNTIIGATGAGLVVQITEQVVQTIQRIDAFFKVFTDRIDERNDQLRSKEQTARIAAGLQQEIITTESGSVDAREAYNTFNEFNNNRAKLEEDFAIRNTTGYDE